LTAGSATIFGNATIGLFRFEGDQLTAGSGSIRFDDTGVLARPFRYYGTTESVTVDDTLTEDESGKTFVFEGGSGGIDLNLPAPAEGVWYRFVTGVAFDTAPNTIVATAAILAGSISGATAVSLCAGTTLSIPETAETLGDTIILYSDGVNWFVSGNASINAAITCA
jgi:hypothetical protein